MGGNGVETIKIQGKYEVKSMRRKCAKKQRDSDIVNGIRWLGSVGAQIVVKKGVDGVECLNLEQKRVCWKVNIELMRKRQQRKKESDEGGKEMGQGR